VAIDPVNFEKPYTRPGGGIDSHEEHATRTGGDKRLTSGYPAITASVVNLRSRSSPTPTVLLSDG